MTPTALTSEARHLLAQQEDHLLAVLSSERFLAMSGLGNEVAHFIYDYDPAWEIPVSHVRKRLRGNLGTQGISVLEIDLYELCRDLLTARGLWERLIEAEPEMDRDDLLGTLRNVLDPEKYLAPAIAKRIEDSEPDIVFLSGIGKVYPYIRSHTVLNNLQTVVSDRPLLMFFPGRYEVSPTQGSALVLFGRLKDDSFYRAKRILDQEV